MLEVLKVPKRCSFAESPKSYYHRGGFGRARVCVCVCVRAKREASLIVDTHNPRKHPRADIRFQLRQAARARVRSPKAPLANPKPLLRDRAPWVVRCGDAAKGVGVRVGRGPWADGGSTAKERNAVCYHRKLPQPYPVKSHQGRIHTCNIPHQELALCSNEPPAKCHLTLPKQTIDVLSKVLSF